MEVLTFTKKAENGKLEIEVPGSFNGKELQVTVSEIDQENKKFRDLPVKERLRILEQHKGTAKYANTKIDKCEWYEQ